MSRNGLWLLTAVLISGCLAGSVVAEERILDYHSDITIAADGSMVVDEMIEVRAEGRQINRGIYRDFPTRYTDRFGNDYVVDFDVVSVRRDGVAEEWHSEKLSNGIRVYAGSANRTVKPGDYVYSIRYRTSRQLGFFTDHDELYWNVTGSGWGFPIDQASALVKLPGRPTVGDISVEGYTGRFGTSGRDYTSWVDAAQAGIRSSRPLAAGEGLTVVVSFPKGLVVEPTAIDRAGYLLKDNVGALLALLALLGSAAYLLVTWHRAGRDPDAGVIFAHYEPPEGYSPASARYISRMSYDAGAFSAAVINLAVKGHLRIEKSDKDYSLSKTRSDSALAPGEAALLDKLFTEGLTLALDNKNHAIVSAARKAHRKALRRDYLNIYFRKNGVLLLPSLLGSVVLFILTLLLGAVTPLAIGLFVFTALLHVLFAYLLKAPTRRGRLLLDRLEGFKLYLNVAEKDDLNIRHPPEKTPALFERYLPFALALGVEQAWAEQFTEVFARLAVEQGQSYQPHWYSGNFDAMRLGSFTSDVSSSFTSAISSAGTPPGSSSGGGGGGFSGGGGGGGGGGGW
jgi:uncharacterized membrane protein YgcG